MRLTVSLGSVLETEGERERGIVLEELGGEGVPPEVVAVVGALLQPLVHLVDAVVGLRDRQVATRNAEPGDNQQRPVTSMATRHAESGSSQCQ